MWARPLSDLTGVTMKNRGNPRVKRLDSYDSQLQHRGQPIDVRGLPNEHGARKLEAAHLAKHQVMLASVPRDDPNPDATPA